MEIHDRTAAIRFLSERVGKGEQTSAATIAQRVLGEHDQIAVSVGSKTFTIIRGDEAGKEKVIQELLVEVLNMAQAGKGSSADDSYVDSLIAVAEQVTQWSEKDPKLIDRLTEELWKNVGHRLRRLYKGRRDGAAVATEDVQRIICLYRKIPPLFMKPEKRWKADEALVHLYMWVCPSPTSEELSAAEELEGVLRSSYREGPPQMQTALQELNQYISIATQPSGLRVRHKQKLPARQQSVASSVHLSSLGGTIARAMAMVGGGVLLIGLAEADTEMKGMAQQAMAYQLCNDLISALSEHLPTPWQQSPVMREVVAPIVTAVTSACTSGGPQAGEVKEVAVWALKYVAGPGIVRALVAQGEKEVQKITGNEVASAIAGALLYGCAIDQWHRCVDIGIEAWSPTHHVAVEPLRLIREPKKQATEPQIQVAEQADGVASSFFSLRNVAMAAAGGVAILGAATASIVPLAIGGATMIILRRMR